MTESVSNLFKYMSVGLYFNTIKNGFKAPTGNIYNINVLPPPTVNYDTGSQVIYTCKPPQIFLVLGFVGLSQIGLNTCIQS